MLSGGKMGDVLQKNSRGWPLYCVAWAFRFRNVFTGKTKEKLGFDYLHAEHAAHARAQFLNANTQKMQFGKLQIISAAPVVGFFAEDDNGDVVSV